MKNNALKFINPILATLLLLALICISLYEIGPQGIRGTEVIKELHAACGILFFLVGLIHLYLNWAWVRINIFGIKKHNHPKK